MKNEYEEKKHKNKNLLNNLFKFLTVNKIQ